MLNPLIEWMRSVEVYLLLGFYMIFIIRCIVWISDEIGRYRMRRRQWKNDFLEPAGLDPEHYMEFFDEGYITGILDYLQFNLTQYRNHNIGNYDIAIGACMNAANSLEKVQKIGKFFLVEKDAEHLQPYIKFIPDAPYSETIIS